MRVRITGVEEGKTIQAIKGLRMVEGSSLKAAKWAIDGVRAGTPYELVATAADISLLRDHSCLIEHVPTLNRDELISALKGFPAEIRVGDLISALEDVRAKNEGGA